MSRASLTQAKRSTGFYGPRWLPSTRKRQLRFRSVISWPVARRYCANIRLMVLTKDELISSLQNEVRILGHLAGKVDKSILDYRPTPKQRSTIELLRYMVIMGPS